MNFISGAKLRRLIPAAAVGAVLAFSFLAPVPFLASSGVGYGNNCGVKGYGYHDHGKPCPNRPFPGKGEGIEKFIGGGITTSTGSGGATSESNGGTTSPGNGNEPTADGDNTTADVNSNTSSPGKGHGHGKGHGRGRGHTS